MKPIISLTKRMSLFILMGLLFILLVSSFNAMIWNIPKTWDITAIEEAHLPPPDSTVEVKFAPESYYNSLPEHVIYKTYPVYAKEFEPPGYLDSLKKLNPEIVFDLSKIKTQEDWIRAGEKVFFWPADFSDVQDDIFQIDSDYLKGSGDHITKEGVYPFFRYVVKEKGRVLTGSLSCAECHSRITDAGDVIIGAQGNVAFDAGQGYIIKKFNFPSEVFNSIEYQLVATPWASGVKEIVMGRTQEEVIADFMARPNGVLIRQGNAYNLPVSVPSLIGLKDIKYLDNTGLMRHQTPADLMRYVALNQGMDMLTSYNGFIPMGINNFSELPKPEEWDNPLGYDPYRYSDAQLYALTQYIYSLKPPENPNHFPEELLKRGEQLFIEQGCVTCHTPPLYTNNMLTPVDGFDPPKEHLETYDIFNVSVETDPGTSLLSRRGTGYYKIPSLRGVWYKGPFFHNGELATLEDVFDPARLEDDYVPTGFKPPNVTTRAVKGHDFGMELSTKDKEALIAFLKTL